MQFTKVVSGLLLLGLIVFAYAGTLFSFDCGLRKTPGLVAHQLQDNQLKGAQIRQLTFPLYFCSWRPLRSPDRFFFQHIAVQADARSRCVYFLA